MGRAEGNALRAMTMSVSPDKLWIGFFFFFLVERGETVFIIIMKVIIAMIIMMVKRNHCECSVPTPHADTP